MIARPSSGSQDAAIRPAVKRRLGCRGWPATSAAMNTVVVDALPASVRENILSFLRSVKLPLSRTYTPVPTWQVFLLLTEYNHNYAAINVEEYWDHSGADSLCVYFNRVCCDRVCCEFCRQCYDLQPYDATYVDIKLYNRFARLPRTAAVEGLIAKARDDFDYTKITHHLCFKCSVCFVGAPSDLTPFYEQWHQDYVRSFPIGTVRVQSIMPRLTRQLLERTRM